MVKQREMRQRMNGIRLPESDGVEKKERVKTKNEQGYTNAGSFSLSQLFLSNWQRSEIKTPAHSLGWRRINIWLPGCSGGV